METIPKIVNRRNCSPEEIEWLRAYLAENAKPVWLYVCGLIREDPRITKGGVSGTKEIGELKTVWSTLGNIPNSRKFFVREVIHILQDRQNENHNKAEEHLQKIEDYMKLLDKGELQLIITLEESKNDLMILDGNTRTVAYFEYGMKRGHLHQILPVYVISSKCTF